VTAGGRLPANPAFVATACALMALVSLSIDAILPGLDTLAADLGAGHGNRRQWVITALFLGLAVGQMVWGPLSDSWGRRKSILLGLAIFTAGSLVSAGAQSFEAMLAGRLIQGFGVAGPRIVTVAMIRDRFDGVAMARLMSLIMSIFILVPILAPFLGQMVLLAASWRVLFLGVMAFGLAAGAALVLTVPERRVARPRLNPRRILVEAGTVLRHRRAMAVTLAGGATYGALMGYVNSSQQVFQDLFGTGPLYTVYFGAAAVFIAAATLANRRLLNFFGMQTVCLAALAGQTVWAAVFLLAELATGGLGLAAFMLFICATLFALGLTFGNFNAMALQDFGAVAGVAAAVQATVTTLGSLVVAAVIGNLYDGSLVPMIGGFVVCGLAALALLRVG
jgi:DHA1 family bicyclomycin/chloramphenicol resistance-like MFS transporter